MSINDITGSNIHYGMREAEIDMARGIIKRDLPLWVNHDWQYEASKREFMRRLKEVYKKHEER